MGRRRQERALEDALTRTLAAGMARGRQEGILSVLARIARRLLGLDTNDAVRMIEQDGPQAAVSGLSRLARDVWVGRWREGLSGALEAIMASATLPTDRGNVPLSFDLANPRTQEFFDSYTLRLAEQVTNTTREKLEAAIREGIEEGLSVPEVARKVAEAGEEFAGYRSELIARTELHRAAIESSEMQARGSGVVKTRTWVTADDERVRAEHRALDGTTVGIDEEFPGGLHPATEINCRCVLTYGIDMEAVRGEVA